MEMDAVEIRDTHVSPYFVLGEIARGIPFEQIARDAGLTADQLLSTIEKPVRILLTEAVLSDGLAPLLKRINL